MNNLIKLNSLNVWVDETGVYQPNEDGTPNIGDVKLYEDINWVKYIEDYSDIKLAGINNKDAVVSHYINYGKKEGRILNYNNEKKYIIHITHQFGGGTMTYINNLIAILNKLLLNKTLIIL
jgi:hypothetical protein